MTSRFTDIEQCLAVIAIATDTPIHEVTTAWKDRQSTHIGWPQDLDAEKFSVRQRDFAISPDRDEYNIWSIAPSGVMVCW